MPHKQTQNLLLHLSQSIDNFSCSWKTSIIHCGCYSYSISCMLVKKQYILILSGQLQTHTICIFTLSYDRISNAGLPQSFLSNNVCKNIVAIFISTHNLIYCQTCLARQRDRQIENVLFYLVQSISRFCSVAHTAKFSYYNALNILRLIYVDHSICTSISIPLRN